MRIGFLALLLVGCTAHPAKMGGPTSDPNSGSMPDIPPPPPPPPGSQITAANPIISRGRPLLSSSGATSTVEGSAVPLGTVNDGALWINDGFAGGVGAWIALDLGTGPTRILFNWISLGGPDNPERQPIDYHLDVSADAKTWRTVVTITGNDTFEREHALDFTGQRWVRLVIDKANGGTAHLAEIESYDASAGSDDTWIVLGDSISAGALNRWITPDVPTTVNGKDARFFPLFIDEAIGGTNTTLALPHIDGWIARFPDVKNYIVAYGTNDGVCPPFVDAIDNYRANLGAIVDKLQAAGKRVLIPHVPWDAQCGSVPAQITPFNDVIDALRAEKNVIAGPDLTAWFYTHQDQLSGDHTHPNDAGEAAMTQLWAATIH